MSRRPDPQSLRIPTPSDHKARGRLSRDLSHGDGEKAFLVRQCPLFEVALHGHAELEKRE